MAYLKSGVMTTMGFLPTTEPTSPITGEMYYNSSSNVIFIYTGSVWERLNNVDMAPITATGGNTVAISGDYKRHTFNASGTFTVTAGSALIDYFYLDTM